LAKIETVIPKALANKLRPALKKREPFITPPSHFNDAAPIVETPRYLKVSDFIQRGGPVEDTLWFRQLAAELESKGVAYHKLIEMKSVEDIHHFFDSYVIPLIESLRNDGFRPEKTGYESAAVIDAQGNLSKVGSGNHRFVIGKVLGLPLYPLRVLSVHADWYARKVMTKGDSWTALKDELSRVEASHRPEGL